MIKSYIIKIIHNTDYEICSNILKWLLNKYKILVINLVFTTLMVYMIIKNIIHYTIKYIDFLKILYTKTISIMNDPISNIKQIELLNKYGHMKIKKITLHKCPMFNNISKHYKLNNIINEYIIGTLYYHLSMNVVLENDKCIKIHKNSYLDMNEDPYEYKDTTSITIESIPDITLYDIVNDIHDNSFNLKHNNCHHLIQKIFEKHKIGNDKEKEYININVDIPDSINFLFNQLIKIYNNYKSIYKMITKEMILIQDNL